MSIEDRSAELMGSMAEMSQQEVENMMLASNNIMLAYAGFVSLVQEMHGVSKSLPMLSPDCISLSVH